MEQRRWHAHGWHANGPGVLLFALVMALGCERSRSDVGPKVNATPDRPQMPGNAGPHGEDQAAGGNEYPVIPSQPPPVPAPAGKGLDKQFNRYIVVDQFGYRPDMRKIAVLADPVRGWNAGEAYEPGPELEVRTWVDAKLVFKGKPAVWNQGNVDESSGDRGSWFDFSSVDTEGLYFVYDPKNFVRSHPFEIGRAVYRKPLIAATKMFYFNRANSAKQPPYSCVGKRCWSLGVDYMGPLQDREARSVAARDNPATNRDLSGGWWDAGDTNKYVTFAHEAVQTLLAAYREHPVAFTDDFGIPESGNGTPDLLDEVKRELDWIKRMQASDLNGGVLLKVGNTDEGDPVPDESHFRRYYYPKPCSASTIAASAMFAHASVVYGGRDEFRDYAADLEKRSVSAFEFYHKNPKSDACDDRTIKSGDADSSLEVQDQQAVIAAIYLFQRTGDAKYGDFVKANYRRLRPYRDDRWSVYDASQGDALLYYATSSRADAAVSKDILGKKRGEAGRGEFYKFAPDRDLYRAYMRPDSYHWGSNQTRATFGNTNFDMVQYGLAAPADRASFVERAEGMLHSFHGVNPMQLVYLTNMYDYGGDECADELFHTWFRDQNPLWDNARTSKMGPAPGYVTGGPNTQYCGGAPPDHACSKSPVKTQPRGKAYVDSNTGWEPGNAFDKSWELTEPGIYYQAAYVRLVSKFVD